MPEKTLDNPVRDVGLVGSVPSLPPSSPIEEYEELHGILAKYPWFTGNISGQNGLISSAIKKEDPDHPMALGTSYGLDALRAMPAHLRTDYYKFAEPGQKVLEDARDDINETIDVNLSPDFHSKVEDLKLLAAEIFGNLAEMGFLPFFDQESFIQAMAETKFYVHGRFDIKSDRHTAAYQNGETIASFGVQNMMNKINFVHELVHRAIEIEYRPEIVGYSPTLGYLCNSIREATVQHIANRGVNFFKRTAHKDEMIDKVLPYPKVEKSARFKRPSFTRYDTKQYEADRRILYELCEGDITVQDFINALSDPSPESLASLQEKLKKVFPDLPGYLHMPITPLLGIIEEYIDGPHAEAMSGGLDDRRERAEALLKKIWLYKDKRDLEQAWSARSAAKKAYALTRHTALRAAISVQNAQFRYHSS